MIGFLGDKDLNPEEGIIFPRIVDIQLFALTTAETMMLVTGGN